MRFPSAEMWQAAYYTMSYKMGNLRFLHFTR